MLTLAVSNIIETLVVKIASDITEFEAGINKALKSTAEFEQAVNKIGNLGEGISKIGTKIADVGTTLTQKLTVPLLGLGTAAIKSYADLEQLMGGVETLFKDSYDTVIANSETAFQRAGMTQNQYLDNVMAFSSRLLQGLGGDTEETARIADMAMTDMSDNANKFGSNIESVQNAYQGFAKANYTMLDNLKLGYGGTKEEMQRLLSDAEKLTGIEYNIENFDDIINAIHVIQDDLNITGTTALEATTTISGSFAMAKNSVLDFLANLGNADADMEALKENMISAITALVKNIKAVIATIWDNIPLEGWQKSLLAAAAAAGPVLVVVGKITSSVGGMITLFSKVSSLAPIIAQIGPAIGAVAGPIAIVVAAVGALIAIFVGLYNTNEEFRSKVHEIWTEISAFLTASFESIKQAAENVFNSIKEFWNTWGDDILAALSSVWDTLKETFSTAIQVIVDIAKKIFNDLKDFWDAWGEVILVAFSVVWETLKETFTSVIQAVIDSVKWIFDSLKEFWNTWGADISSAFFSVLNTLSDTFSSIFESVWNVIKSIFDRIMEFWDTWGGIILEIFKAAFNWIKELVEKVFTDIKRFWDTWGNSISAFFTAVWKQICNVFETALNVIKNVFKVFEGVFTGDWQKAWEGIKGIFSSILEGIKNAFKIAFDSFLYIAKEILDNMKTAISDKLNAVKEVISGILDNVTRMFTDLPGKALEWGKNLIGGFIDGIKGMAGAVSDAASSVINNAADFLGFHSPAKKGEGRYIVEWGYNMIKGFTDGAIKAIPLVNSTMDKVIPDINSAIANIKVTRESARPSSIGGRSLVGGGTVESKTEVKIYTEGLFKGAVLTVRDETDIAKIADMALAKISGFVEFNLRDAGTQRI